MKLWTKDFTLITIGTIISAIGGTAMRFALGLVVFDNTGSTWLTGLFEAVTLIPSALLPILSAPFVDSHCRQRIIVRLDALTGVIYLAFAAYQFASGFSYTMFMLFGLATGCLGTVYQQAYGSLYPELIPDGKAQKGYAVSSTVYPLAMTLITPVAAWVYVTWGIVYIFLAEGVLLLIASSFERLITPDRAGREKKRFCFRAYRADIMGGIRYLKADKGVRDIYTYMTFSISFGSGTYLMSQVFFQSSSVLTTGMFSLLQSSETLGRVIGGFLHYIIKIPVRWRFKITVAVYTVYNTLDGIMLLLAYPLMIVIRFIVGFLGVNSFTLREAAVQRRLPSEVRARVEALFTVMISVGVMLLQLAAGALGEVLQYPVVSLIFMGVGYLYLYAFVLRNRKDIARIYEEHKG